MRPLGTTRASPVWHVFVDGAVHVVGSGIEQPLPSVPEGSVPEGSVPEGSVPEGEEVEVTVRSKTRAAAS
ncbi:MAG: hypothetical protein LH461_08480 [Spirochaetaceae bacterium]|nr:hypothetical protein [Spirochaetaceae bacterium]